VPAAKLVEISINEKLTVSKLKAYKLPDGVDRAWWWDSDTPGFGVCVGRRFTTFAVKHRVEGKQVRSTIGRWNELGAGDDHAEVWTVERAWKEARRRLALMSDGEDPDAAARAKRGGPTLAEAGALYIENLRAEGARPKSIEAIDREILDRGADKQKGKPKREGSYLLAWLDRPLASIDGAECRERHAEITKANGPHVANRVMRELRAIWNHVTREAIAGTLVKDHGVAKGTVFAANPTVAVKWNTEKAGKLVTRRQEPIAWKDLPAWHKAVIALGEKSTNASGEVRLGSPVRRDYNLIALLTGLRRSDVASIRWEHCNLTDEPAEVRVWHAVKKKWETKELPPHSMIRPSPKGGAERSFVIPLSTQVVDILDQRKKENIKDNGWVFPTAALKSDKERARPCYTCADLGQPPHERGATVHLTEPKEDGDVLVSPHRLRDTYTTALAEVTPKLSPFVIDVLTNHRPPRGSVTAGYIDLGLDALADAQQRVADYIMARTKPTGRHLKSVV
jgi:integrase